MNCPVNERALGGRPTRPCVEPGALALLVAGGGAFGAAVTAAVLLGAGTALVYPTLIAAVSDAVEPRQRAQSVGVYRFWRDAGFVVGALAAGFGADAAGSGPTIAAVAALTAASGLAVAATRWRLGSSVETTAAIAQVGLDDRKPRRTLA